MPPQRRLSDRIVDAHALACEEGRLDVAEILLQALEVELSAMGGTKIENRKQIEMLEAAFELHESAKAKERTKAGV
jgi:hypothetical protein